MILSPPQATRRPRAAVLLEHIVKGVSSPFCLSLERQPDTRVACSVEFHERRLLRGRGRRVTPCRTRWPSLAMLSMIGLNLACPRDRVVDSGRFAQHNTAPAIAGAASVGETGQNHNVAERGRFELPLPFRADRFSKPAHSTTLPPLRVEDGRYCKGRRASTDGGPLPHAVEDGSDSAGLHGVCGYAVAL
ncbi:MAG: hypothetical protein JWM97_1673 [Phycisphaerales bacterium]|nr:hypothetical protein [Phycisphaerales bacterium]